ncbi:MAG: MarR family transcriptional regulator [Vicinamibacteria bacterium]|nr:MarR family transcriptional regulator [Vicinamibacteria bacterium]
MVALSPRLRKFILHWGEMGARWGINRTLAQIHALLYIAAQPIDAEEIADTLSIARSNVSTGVRELRNWGLIRVVRGMGDRRERYEALTDVWEMFEKILVERKRRELDPAIEVLRECVRDSECDADGGNVSEARLAELLAFLETMSAWFEKVRSVPISTVKKAIHMSGNVFRIIEKIS